MAKSVQTMTNFMSVLQDYSSNENADGISALDDAVSSISRFSSLEDAVNNFINDTASTSTYSNVNERLQATCGIVLGASDDYTADTGAVSGANAGGATVKDAQSIVPETADLTSLNLPATGSTTTHTYTGEDGKSFTFYVKWPSSFTSFYDYRGINSDDEFSNLSDADHASRYIDASSLTTYTSTDNSNSVTLTGSQLVSGENTLVKGLYNFWLSEGLKLAYDSYGLDFGGKTIEIKFAGGGNYVSTAQAMTEATKGNGRTPTDSISMLINLPTYAVIDPNDQNGNTKIDGGAYQVYFDRTIAHELIHAVMFGKGIMKVNMPEFFTEGVAELVMGLDDDDANNTSDILDLAESFDSLSTAMVFAEGTGNSKSYTAGYMFLRYLCRQSLNTEVQFGNSAEPVTFEATGGETIINDYKSSDQINYAKDFTGLGLTSDDFILNSSNGNVYIRNVKDKLVNVADSAGNVIAYAYMAKGGGELNGGSFDKLEVIVGADSLSNTITAGSGGSSLWGGAGSAKDILTGGAGDDVFFYAFGNGADAIQNATTNDTVNLIGMTLDQVAGASIANNGVNLTFSDGGSLTISGQAGNFVLGGANYHADYQNKIWTT